MSIGNLLMAARADAAKIVSAGGFQVTATLSTPNGLTQLVVKGSATGTWMVFDDLQSGKPINSRSNSFTIGIDQLIVGEYPYLKDGRPYLTGHKIIVTDEGGIAGTYVISEQHPNTTLGIIPCILGASE